MEFRDAMRWLSERFKRRGSVANTKYAAIDFMGRTQYSATAETSPSARAAADFISRHVSTHRVMHIGPDGSETNSDISVLFRGRPSPIYTMPAFLQRVSYDLVLRGNAIIAVETNGGKVRSLWVVDARNADFARSGDEIYVRITSPYTVTIPYENVVHITYRRTDDMVGASLDGVLINLFRAERDLIRAIEKSAQMSASTRFVAKMTGSLVARKDLDAHRKYIAEALSGASGTGVAILDETVSDVTDVKQTGIGIEASLLRTVQDSILSAYGVSQQLISGEYTEEMYNAFYDSVISPLVNIIASEFETKLFTQRERTLGNKIIIQSPRAIGTSIKTKLEIARLYTERGMMSVNEARSLFGFDPIEGGEKVMQSLNFVDAGIANKYQLGGDEND